MSRKKTIVIVAYPTPKVQMKIVKHYYQTMAWINDANDQSVSDLTVTIVTL